MTEALKHTLSNKTSELNKDHLLPFNYCDEPLCFWFWVTVITITGLLFKYVMFMDFTIAAQVSVQK